MLRIKPKADRYMSRTKPSFQADVEPCQYNSKSLIIVFYGLHGQHQMELDELKLMNSSSILKSQMQPSLWH